MMKRLGMQLFIHNYAIFQLHPVAEPVATSVSEEGKKLLVRVFVAAAC